MTRWVLNRQIYTPQSVRGEMLDAQPKHLAWTLEAPVAEYPAKWHCIPPDTYEVVLYNSPRFGRVMPLLLTPNLPDNFKIEIHWGNFPENFEGCIGVGRTFTQDAIWATREKWEELFPIIEYAVEHGGLQLEIVPGAIPLHPDLSSQM